MEERELLEQGHGNKALSYLAAKGKNVSFRYQTAEGKGVTGKAAKSISRYPPL
jgi:hypothetical protein